MTGGISKEYIDYFCLMEEAKKAFRFCRIDQIILAFR